MQGRGYGPDQLGPSTLTALHSSRSTAYLEGRTHTTLNRASWEPDLVGLRQLSRHAVGVRPRLRLGGAAQPALLGIRVSTGSFMGRLPEAAIPAFGSAGLCCGPVSWGLGPTDQAGRWGVVLQRAWRRLVVWLALDGLGEDQSW